MRVKETATPYQPSPKHYTYADYVQLPDDGKRYEIIEGELFMSPSPTPLHQEISKRLMRELDRFVENNHSGRVLYAPIDVVLNDENIVQPDILYVSKENEKIITEKNIQGAPDLIVEILSPATAYNDLVNKKDLYAQFGVKEYWIVDPGKQWIEIDVLSKNEYQIHQPATKSGSVSSHILHGFRINVTELFSRK